MIVLTQGTHTVRNKKESSFLISMMSIRNVTPFRLYALKIKVLFRFAKRRDISSSN